MDRYGWSSERFQLGMLSLLHEGIAWIDEYQGMANYEFPAYQGGFGNIDSV